MQQRYCFLEGLIRDQAPEFAGLGVDLVDTAVARWRSSSFLSRFAIRVHSMKREWAAVRFWTRYLRRGPDFCDAYVAHADHRFEAVGWMVEG